MKKFNWEKTIVVNIFLLKIVGLWPKGDETYKANLYTLYAMFGTTLFTIGHSGCQVINFFFLYDDIKTLTASVFVALTHLIAVAKTYYLIQNMGKLKQLMITLRSDMFQPRNEYQRKMVQPDMKAWKILASSFWGTSICTIFFWTTFPILDKSYREFRLPFLAWYPYNTKVSPFYQITYIHQILSACYICTVNLSIDTLIGALNMYVGAQCDILCDDLSNLNLSEENTDLNRKIIDCIVHHKRILKFAEDSNIFFNWIVLMQFFTSAISIGLTMFQLTLVVPMASQFFSFLFYLIAITVQIFMYCWFGNEVEVKSAKIPYSVFQSNWTGASEETKKIMLFFSLRCQSPIKMSALKLFFLSLETFMAIMRTSWSYFAVLHQVSMREGSEQFDN